MVSLAANGNPAGRRECNDAHLYGGIELDDRPDLLRGWRRFDYGHRIPAGNTGSRVNIPAALRDQWKLDYVAIGHCTGETTFAALQKTFRDRYIYAGVGTAVNIP